MPSLEEKKTPANKKQKKTPKENPSPKEKDTPMEEENGEEEVVEAPASDEASTSTGKKKRKERSDKNGTRMKVQQLRVQNNVRQVYINGQWRELEPTKVRNVVWCVFIVVLLGKPAGHCSI